MDSFNEPFGQLAEQKCASEIGMLRAPTPRERLTRKKENLERELTAVNAAIEILDANPNVEQVMTLVQRAL